MNVIKQSEVEPQKDSNYEVRPLYSAKEFGVSHITVLGTVGKHLHKEHEEVFIITKGSGIIGIGEEEREVKEGDVIPIPKNTWHYVKVKDKPFEIIEVTSPQFDSKDMIFQK